MSYITANQPSEPFLCDSGIDEGERHNINQSCRPVVLACDESYAMPLATALRSIVESSNRSGWPVEFHVLSDDLKDSTRERVIRSLPTGSASIRWVPVDLSKFMEIWTRHYISKMTFARFLIPNIFPENVSRILYLDIDILVLDDLTQLWETDLHGAILGAVLDNLDSHFKSGRPGYEGVPRVLNYFNAGVLLIDLDRWRKENVSEKALTFMNEHPDSPFSDQDALNVVCDGRWEILDGRWNFHDCWSKRISDFSPSNRPGIAHFVSTMKPWDVRALSVNASFYDDYRSRTCFARTPSEKFREGVIRASVHLKKYLKWKDSQ